MGCFSQWWWLCLLILVFRVGGQEQDDGVDAQINCTKVKEIDCTEVSSIVCDTCALRTIKSRLNDASKNNYSSWVGDNPCDGSWLHVHCEDVSKNESQFRVTNLTMGQRYWSKLDDGSMIATRNTTKEIKFDQALPIELTQMYWLQYMEFSSLRFSGTIFPEISALENLVVLDLEWNEWISGSIPSELSALQKLQVINLRANIITGSIPSELSALQKLQIFEVTSAKQRPSNRITGTLPQELSSLLNLKYFGVVRNEINGSLPLEYSTLSQLEVLQVLLNQITGKLPVEYTSMLNLRKFYVYGNEITGSMPVEYSSLKNLTVISVGKNQITGILPVEYSNLQNLTEFSFENNQITGSLPQQYLSLSNLEQMSLQNNNISVSCNKGLFLDWINATTDFDTEDKCTDVKLLQQGAKETGQQIQRTILVGVLSSVIPFVAIVITIFVLWRRYAEKNIRGNAKGTGLNALDMKGMSELISNESRLQQFSQPQNWWADIKIPEDVREIPITHLKEIRKLGAGGFAMVYEVKISDNVQDIYKDLCDQQFAVKIVNKQFTQIKDQVEAIIKEIKVMKDLNNENVVQLIGASLHLLPSIVMELLPEGSLEKLLYREGFKSHQTSLTWKLQLMLNISKRVQYLHSIEITHRDLKPQNILIKDKHEAEVKISDFGLSKLKQSTISVQKCVGTMQYMAPEVVLQQFQTITKKVDVWALGVIMQEIIRGVEPWKGENPPYIMGQLTQNQPPANGELPQEGCPQELSELIKSCWKEAQDRPSAQEIVNKLEENLQTQSTLTDLTEQYSSKSNEAEQSYP